MPTRSRGPGGPDERPRRTAAARGLGTEEDDPFDLWLQRGLRGAFGAIAAEPVPEDILRLIEEDRAEREHLRRRRRATREEG